MCCRHSFGQRSSYKDREGWREQSGKERWPKCFCCPHNWPVPLPYCYHSCASFSSSTTMPPPKTTSICSQCAILCWQGFRPRVRLIPPKNQFNLLIQTTTGSVSFYGAALANELKAAWQFHIKRFALACLQSLQNMYFKSCISVFLLFLC